MEKCGGVIVRRNANMKYLHVIDKDRCKGCGLCVTTCPKNVLEISDQVNTKGYFPAFRARPEDCIYCAMCCTMCPDVAIDISEEAEAPTGSK
jgi:2-oxoglutarate ferredoxin oxidoreductase subunit delta